VNKVSNHTEKDALSRGAYGASEGVRLLNFNRGNAEVRNVSRNTVARWLRGYNFGADGKSRSEPLWRPDYNNDDQLIEFSFRDLIELRFVKAFRDAGLALPTIRACYERAAEEVKDERPFSTRKFRTDGKTIFLDITEGLEGANLIDLRQRQNVFRTMVEPSLKDLEFDASAVSRWFPLGMSRKSVVIDPTRSFGRPMTASGVPTEVLRRAVEVEGSIAKVAKLYDATQAEIKDSVFFEDRLAA
jgi:DNA-binding transcriptional MerR regulator